MKYIEMTINTSKDKKDIIDGILFDYGIYTTEEVSTDLVDELDQDEKDWDFIDYPLLNSEKDIFAIKVYPENLDDAKLNLKKNLWEIQKLKKKTTKTGLTIGKNIISP